MPRETAFRVRRDLLWQEVDGEVVVLDPRRGRYFGIGGSGASAWRRLGRWLTLERLAVSLAEEYRTGRVRVRRDLEAFCSDLARQGLLERK